MVARLLTRAASTTAKVMIVLLALAFISMPQNVSAAGGVGSGGSGSGGTGGGPWGWTNYGHGWALYSTGGSGPTAGFHTGSWSTVKSTCQAADASKVAIYIIGTGAPNNGGANGNFMGYSDVGYSGAWDTSGTNRDNSRATESWSRSKAKTNFDNLGDYGVSTAGYTWGSNVGWFCWDFKPPSATLTKNADPDINTNVGATQTYRNWVNNSNVYNVGSRNFDWNITGQGPDSGANVNIDGGNPRITRSHSQTFGTRGAYSRTINVFNYPSYVVENGDGTQTINVRGWTLGAGSSVVASGNVGSPVTFTHSFTNTVTNDVVTGDGAPTNSAITGNVYTGGGVWVDSFSQPGGLTRGLSSSKANNQTFNTRGRYCQYVNVSKRTESTGAFNSGQACVDIKGWGVQGISTVSSRVVVEGTPVTFTHTIINNDPTGGATTTAQINLDLKGKGMPVDYAPGNVDCTVPAGLPFGGSNANCKSTINNLPPGVWCQNIGYGQIADNNGAWADSGNACVTVVALTPTVSVNDHEKGFGNEPINHGVVILPCPPAGAGTVTFNINISGREGNGVVYNNAVSVTLGNGNCTYNHPVKTVNGTWLDGQAPGTSITYATNAILDNMLIYEVPYAQFTGQDVRACSDASANRFMWDQRPTGIASYGSNSQYASFFKAGNTDGTYTGLNTLAGAAMNRLRANWSALTAPNCSTPSATIANTSAGDIVVGGSGIVNVGLIKTPTNIYIGPNVTTLNGILIAGGNIYTCATSSTAPARTDWESSCRNRLVVNGALYANTVVFQRSVGSRYLNPATDGPAEIVNFPASLNFTDIPGMPDSSSGKYSSFRSVSPRL